MNPLDPKGFLTVRDTLNMRDHKSGVNGKLETALAIITSCKPNVLGNMNVTLKDPSGTTSGTIHYKVLSSEDGYAKDIKVRSALILRNVSVFYDKSKNYALNITIKNLVKIINKY
ncbi:EEIG1/EHBP1 N-terminal domain-containing protein, partial [Tanacetum coccineum]